MFKTSCLLLLISTLSYCLECTSYKGNMDLGVLKVSANKSDISIVIQNTGKIIKGEFETYIGENIRYQLENLDPLAKWKDTAKLSLRSYGNDRKYFLTLTEHQKSYKYRREFVCK